MDKLRILMVTAEYAPFAKTGGLADMVAGLSGTLARAGHDVRVILPRYRSLDPSQGPENAGTSLGEVQVSPVRLGDVHPPYSIELLPGEGPPAIYRVDAPAFFATGGIYGGGDAEARRFALLSHGALRLCQVLNWSPQIIHCHDWHAALVPGLLRSGYLRDPGLRQASTLLTIHNIGYQGVFAATLAEDLGLAPTSGPPEPNLNFLRSGIAAADALTTVSPTHAAEILTPQYGKGLDALLRQRRNRLVGILNGVDYGSWDPATDSALVANYTPGRLDGKTMCRDQLRRIAGLQVRPGVPVFGMVSRLAEQKGIELLIGALPGFLERGQLQAVVLGDGEARYATALADLAGAFPGDFAFISAQDETLARRVFAGADAFLVPSLYEPCGLTQMYALRYGAIPVVRETGGLRDTVRHFDPATGTGTGSVFRDADATGLAWGIGEVLRWHGDPATFKRLRANGMQADFSWDHQAPHYVDLYRRLAGVAPGGAGQAL